MKKILALVAVLALVAALVVPMAVSADGPTQLTGAIVAPSITVTPPTAILFNTFTFGTPVTVESTGAGSVGVTFGSANDVNWSVTALDTAFGNGYMYLGATSTHLTDPLLIASATSGWDYANGTGSGGTLTFTGTNVGTFNFWAQQTAVPADPAGSYWDTVQFTGMITSFN